MTKDLATIVIERDALAGVVAEQRRVIQLMANAIVASREAFEPNIAVLTKACVAIEDAGQALLDAGLSEL